MPALKKKRSNYLNNNTAEKLRSVCIGLIQAGAFFIFRKLHRAWAEIPRHAQGKVRLLPAFEEGCVAFPPLTLSPQDTLTCWEEDIDAYRVHTPTAQPANQPSMPKWESSSFPAGDFLEQPNQKEERNVDQIQKQRTREIL